MVMDMRMSSIRREFLYERLISLKNIIKDYDGNKKKKIQGEIDYIENMLRADEFSTNSEYPVF
jgi:hypothetical protein